MAESTTTLSGVTPTPLPGAQASEPKQETKTEPKQETKTAPKKETKEVSARTYKARIKKLQDELAAKDLEVQEATDKALIFQGEARMLKEALEANKVDFQNTLIAIRGSVVNSVNIIDVMGGK